MSIPDTPACVASHLGLVACERIRFMQAVSQVKSGARPMRAVIPGATGAKGYSLEAEGVAVVRMSGILTKAPSKFEDTTSTALTRRAVRAAVADPAVNSILLVIDSPGGYVEGTDDLARDVAAAAAKMPVECYIEDLCASAAYWVGSQAQKVWCNPTGFVGSIGVYQVVHDMSKAAEMAGIAVHVVSTGNLKGGGVEGAPVTEEFLAAVQSWVDDTNEHFLGAVRHGRAMTPKAVESLATGDIWIADKAKANGLIDGVKPLDAVLAALSDRGAKAASRARGRAAAAAFELEAAGGE